VDTAPPRYGLCASVPPPLAQRTLDALGRRDAVDEGREVVRRGERVLVPVTDADAVRELEGARLEEAHLPPDEDRPPRARVREALRGRVPDRLLGALPNGWHRIGDVVLLRLPDELREHGDALGEAYGAVLDADAVLELRGARGELREPDTRHLWGDEDTETVHREHGLAFELDPAEVLFSAGNHAERHRLVDRVREGERVVDLFAGVGYFTLPLARAGARVTACELNPTSASYLAANAERNELADRVEVRRGDAREVAPADAADRVLMGYLPRSTPFLATARRALAPGGGRLHVHETAPASTPIETAWQRVRAHGALGDAEIDLPAARRVKTVGPSEVHVVLDVEVTP